MARTYLMTAEEVNRVALGDLGPLDSGKTWDDFRREANEVVGTDNPLLVLAGPFRPGAHPFLSEIVYPLTETEMAQFVVDIPDYCDVPPRMYVVDGALYTAPI